MTLTLPPVARLLMAVLAAVLVLGGCSDALPPEPLPEGRYQIDEVEVAAYETAYIAEVQVPTQEQDGFILLRNNWNHPADVGGWAIRARNARTLRIPPSTFVEPNGELRIHLGSGDSDEDDLYLDIGEEILEWDRLRLVDAAGDNVARFSYGR